jgi:L-fuconolactonase
MRIDAHQHFWRYTPEEYGWIDESMRAIRRDFLPPDLAPLLAAARLDGTVAVQARQTLAETHWLLGLALDHPLIKGVVGWVPLADPGIATTLDELARHPHLKGLRHVVQAEPAGFLDNPAFNAGIREITARGLTYDILIYAHQLEEATRFVDRHPSQRFVLDHLAKPLVSGPPPPAWRTALRALARRPNVACKFSGLVTEVPGRAWTPELLHPYFDVALEAFGPARLMFGSDWPVCLVAAGYAPWFAFVESCTAALSVSERQRILGGTAAEFYRL